MIQVFLVSSCGCGAIRAAAMCVELDIELMLVYHQLHELHNQHTLDAGRGAGHAPRAFQLYTGSAGPAGRR